MKRRREMEKQISSELSSAIEDISLLAVIKLNHRRHDPEVEKDQQNDTHIPIKPFFSLCVEAF